MEKIEKDTFLKLFSYSRNLFIEIEREEKREIKLWNLSIKNTETGELIFSSKKIEKVFPQKCNTIIYLKMLLEKAKELGEEILLSKQCPFNGNQDIIQCRNKFYEKIGQEEVIKIETRINQKDFFLENIFIKKISEVFYQKNIFFFNSTFILQKNPI